MLKRASKTRELSKVEEKLLKRELRYIELADQYVHDTVLEMSGEADDQANSKVD